MEVRRDEDTQDKYSDSSFPLLSRDNAGTDYEVHLTVSKQEFDLTDQFADNAEFEGRIHLFDGQGHEFSLDQLHVHTSDNFVDPESFVVPFERSSEDGGGLFHIAKLGTPQKLVIEIPDVRAVEVPVEFRNLPLP